MSTILVIGGSGDYFEVADHVIMMDEYIPVDVTRKAREIIKGIENPRKIEGALSQENPPRILLKSSFPVDKKGVKIKPRGRDAITYNRTEIDLRDLEQLIDSNQTNTICFMLQYIMQNIADDRLTLSQVVERVYNEVVTKGLDVVSPYRGHPGNMALPRKYEIAGTLNRFRNLRIK